MTMGRIMSALRLQEAIFALQINDVPVPPFCPELKPHVERVIQTISHSLFERLPGYVGHNVAEAQAIREPADSFAVEDSTAKSEQTFYQSP